MADRKLKLILSGISTLFPAPPLDGETPPDRAYVLMAANYTEATNALGGKVPQHFPFIYVPQSALVGPVPPPKAVVNDDKLGPCNLYVLDNARVKLEPPPPPGVSYFSDHRLPLSDRPGSDDVAPENDIRWLADLREIVPGHSLMASVDPRKEAVGPEVAAVVELSGGTIKAGFPCKSVQPKKFKDATGRVVDVKPTHVLPNEFFVEMTYPAVMEVTLRLTPLRDGAPSGVAGNALVVRLPEKGVLEIHMGNDTVEEAKLATSFERCNARRRPDGEPVIIRRDDDFDLHYGLLGIPPNLRPLPQNDPHQTQFDGCKPATTP